MRISSDTTVELVCSYYSLSASYVKDTLLKYRNMSQVAIKILNVSISLGMNLRKLYSVKLGYCRCETGKLDFEK
jgi:hypothetical protein